MNLDRFDKAILNIVQQDNLIAHSKIGEQIGLSTSSVRRRLHLMRQAGIIQQNIALLSPSFFGITFIISIVVEKSSAKVLRGFEKRVMKLPEVMQCYHVSGIYDFVMLVIGPSVDWFEEWSEINLVSDENVRRHETTVVWSCKKFKTHIKV